MSSRWLVAMSGGVDSSVAAGLMQRRGAEVVGVTMDLGVGSARDVAPSNPKKCCGLPDAEDARAVARKLGFRHYTVNYSEAFHTSVIVPFIDAYQEGSTPIPCIACKRVLKFDLLIERARALGALGVATGHYARIAPGPDGGPSLYRPRDRAKDQTYFLFDLPRERLSEIEFPLGDLEKSQVRSVARELELVTADKPESQDICFIPESDVRGALHRLRPELPREPGDIVDGEGAVLGRHGGAIGYTQGQRRGLGLSGGPWYVSEIRSRENLLVVAREEDLQRCEILVGETHWIDGAAPEGPVRVQVRHRQSSVPARVKSASGSDAGIVFEAPVWAPARGQAAVVYDAEDQRVLGGGWISA